MIKLTLKEIAETNISLPTSKSISNRALMIRAMCSEPVKIVNISHAADTILMQDLLIKIENNINCRQNIVIDTGNAGTVFRFLTALCSITEGNWYLTGCSRMMQRPVEHLVTALRNLGTEISYAGQTNYPPLLIRGAQLNKNEVSINASVSSQYISALMMIAPSIPGGLRINTEGRIVSMPYIYMTSELMKHFGVKTEIKPQQIHIQQGKYKGGIIEAEADWSSSSYWYQLISLCGGKTTINNLHEKSIQGDAIVSNIFSKLRVSTIYNNGSIIISKFDKPITLFEEDFTSCPDLFPTVAVTCAGLGIKAKLSGLENLVIKESDRITAIVDNLRICGFKVNRDSNKSIEITGERENISSTPIIKTYGDHRIAMSFAPLAAIIGELWIDDHEVVEKSYPSYWDDLKKAGFEINTCYLV